MSCNPKLPKGHSCHCHKFLTSLLTQVVGVNFVIDMWPEISKCYSCHSHKLFSLPSDQKLPKLPLCHWHTSCLPLWPKTFQNLTHVIGANFVPVMWPKLSKFYSCHGPKFFFPCDQNFQNGLYIIATSSSVIVTFFLMSLIPVSFAISLWLKQYNLCHAGEFCLCLVTTTITTTKSPSYPKSPPPSGFSCKAFQYM